jgi:hypothetical protein
MHVVVSKGDVFEAGCGVLTETPCAKTEDSSAAAAGRL